MVMIAARALLLRSYLYKNTNSGPCFCVLICIRIQTAALACAQRPLLVRSGQQAKGNRKQQK